MRSATDFHAASEQGDEGAGLRKYLLSRWGEGKLSAKERGRTVALDQPVRTGCLGCVLTRLPDQNSDANPAVVTRAPQEAQNGENEGNGSRLLLNSDKPLNKKTTGDRRATIRTGRLYDSMAQSERWCSRNRGHRVEPQPSFEPPRRSSS